MKITGQILKENRERRGISVNEVAIATKINVRTIMAMEAGDVDKLPPKTFLRGFVRAYATYLELDVESLLNTFFDEMGSTKPKAIASLRGKLKRYLLVRKKIWYLVHALAAIDLFLFPLSASVCPIHHGGDREAIILVFQTVIQRSS